MYNSTTNEVSISKNLDNLASCQYEIQDQLSSALLMQIIYNCQHVPDLAFNLNSKIIEILPDFSADDGAFFISVEPKTHIDLSNYLSGTKTMGGIFAQEIVNSIRDALPDNWFITDDLSELVDSLYLGKGGHDVKYVTVKSSLTDTLIEFILRKTTLNKYQKTTVNDVVTCRTGINNDNYNKFLINSSDNQNSDSIAFTVSEQLSIMLQRLNGLSYSTQKFRTTVPGSAASYGSDNFLLRDLIKTLGSKFEYYKSNGSLTSYDATIHELEYSDLMDKYLLEPLGMDTTTCGKATKRGRKIRDVIIHLETVPSEIIGTDTSDTESDNSYIIPSLRGLLSIHDNNSNDLFSTSKDIVKFLFTLGNHGVALNGQRVFASAVVNILNTISVDPVVDQAFTSQITDWNNTWLWCNSTNHLSIPKQKFAGLTVMNAPGSYITTTVPKLQYWNPQKSQVQQKCGYGGQVAVRLIDCGIFLHSNTSFIEFAGTGTSDISRVLALFDTIVTSEVLDGQRLASWSCC